jgi:hypothetical protein
MDHLHCLLILLLPKLHFLSSGVQFHGEHNGKVHLLLEFEVACIGYKLYMDVSRSTSSLGKMSILRSINPRVGDGTCDTPSVTLAAIVHL